jgi:hypothetical protein
LRRIDKQDTRRPAHGCTDGVERLDHPGLVVDLLDADQPGNGGLRRIDKALPIDRQPRSAPASRRTASCSTTLTAANGALERPIASASPRSPRW